MKFAKPTKLHRESGILGHIHCPLTIETRFQLAAARLPVVPFAQSNNTVPGRGAHECDQDVCVAAVPADRSEFRSNRWTARFTCTS
jgi:hypothetical protein